MNINGIEYHIEQQGQGIPLLLLHGFTGSSENWVDCVALLSTHYRVLTVDLIGHGRTASPDNVERYALDRLCDDLHAIIKVTFSTPIHLLGYSMGGRIALYLAWKFPELFRTLSLESASAGIVDPTEREARRLSDEALADRILTYGIESFVREWEQLPLWKSQQRLPSAVQTRLHQQRLKNTPIGLANALRGFGTGVQPSLWEHLPEVTLPTLLIAGALDTKFVQIADQMQQGLGNSHKTIIADVGHTTHLEQTTVFCRFLLEFLAVHE